MTNKETFNKKHKSIPKKWQTRTKKRTNPYQKVTNKQTLRHKCIPRNDQHTVSKATQHQTVIKKHEF